MSKKRCLLSLREQVRDSLIHIESYSIEMIRNNRIVEIEFGEFIKTRSKLQNRYLNGWVYKQISKALEDAGISIQCSDGTEIPYTRDILHDCVFADRFRVIDEVVIMGEKKNIYEHTSKMTMKRFSEYVRDIKNFCHSYWGITIPEPDNGYWESILMSISVKDKY